jgi:23S rRNA (adenine2503-C2)-methyltransferase
VGPAGPLRDERGRPRLELHDVARDADGTKKLVWTLRDGHHIESVLIPDESRLTLCISTQVGCAMGCRFCLPGDMGLVRNLSPSEIALQVAQAGEMLAEDERITNLVVMGMGEPLHNLDNLLVALATILAPDGLGFSHRKVTVSTVGLVPAIHRLAERHPVNLAVSLNATTDTQRSAMMPVNRRHGLHELLDACRTIPLSRRKRIVFEYVLMEGFNTDIDDAERLAGLLRDLPAKVNLVPYNENPDRDIVPPSTETVRAFAAHLRSRGIQCSVRASRGAGIFAACGQLGRTARLELREDSPTSERCR